MEKYYEEELDMDEEYRIYDELFSKALDQLDITADMIARNQFQSIAREARCNLSALEDSMAMESKATYSDDMAAIAANLEKLSVYSGRCTDLEKENQAFHTRFLKLKAEAEIREDSKAVAHKSLFIDDSSSSTSVSRTDNIKLPKLELPTFDGEPLSWPLFWERSSVAIDQNSRLSDEEKLAYLRSAMKSPLAKQIVSTQTGGSRNYSTLLNLLKQTFEDKRKIYCNHLNSLLDATGYKLHYEDMVKLGAIWEQNLTGLEATGMFDVERFCTALAIRNMSPEVHHEWAKYIKGHDGIPPINVFKDFLTEQMRTLRPGVESHLKKPTTQNYSSYRPKPIYKSFYSSHYWRFYFRILCSMW